MRGIFKVFCMWAGSAFACLAFAYTAFAQTAQPYIDANSNGQYDTGEEITSVSNGDGGGTHTINFDIPATGDPSTAQLIIDFAYIDNSISVQLNGADVCIPSVCQFEQTWYKPGSETFLTFSGGDFDQPWVSNNNGLARLRLVINNSTLTSLGTRFTTSTSYATVIASAGGFGSPSFVAGQNEVVIVNPDDGGLDSMLATPTVTYSNFPASISVTKTASPDTNVAAGQVVTYTYVVSNDGGEPVSNISLSDAHNGSGTFPTPSNETLTTDTGTVGDSTDATPNNGVWDVLAAGDQITFTAQYTVTQSDVDNLQ